MKVITRISPIAAFLVTIVILATSCGQKKQPLEAVPAQTEAVDTAAADSEVADSTIYGRSDEFGMSTFTLITDAGDTLFLTRSTPDGRDGTIYGDMVEGARYALTTSKDGEAINTLVNLTQIKKHVKDYEIRNGLLYLEGRPVVIDRLDDQTFKYHFKDS